MEVKADRLVVEFDEAASNAHQQQLFKIVMKISEGDQETEQVLCANVPLHLLATLVGSGQQLLNMNIVGLFNGMHGQRQIMDQIMKRLDACEAFDVTLGEIVKEKVN